MINEIIALGAQIENKWSSLDNHKDKFAKICLDALESFSSSLELSEFEEEVGKWLIENELLPEQLNVYNGFGHPPVTIYNNSHFVIDVYFWTYFDTSIHSHSFAGAFKVLYGQSLHEIFKLELDTQFTHDIAMNKLALDNASIMQQNDCHLINSGENFCHRVVHLDQPTISLCIRTLNDSQTPQWHYFENGLSIRKRELSQDIYKKIYYFQYLYEKDQDKGSMFLESFMLKLEDSQVMNLFEQILTDGMGLNEFSAKKVHEFVVDRYKNQKWFSFYEQFYEENQFFIEPQADTALDRFHAHATNTKYTQERVKEIEAQIK